MKYNVFNVMNLSDKDILDINKILEEVFDLG